MKTYNMSEEIKQKAREELRELFPLEYLRNEIDNFGYASLENWIDDLLSQAVQDRAQVAVQAEHDRWANQTANEHDNKIRQIALQKRDAEILDELENLMEKHKGFASVVLATLANQTGLGNYQL